MVAKVLAVALVLTCAAASFFAGRIPAQAAPAAGGAAGTSVRWALLSDSAGSLSGHLEALARIQREDGSWDGILGVEGISGDGSATALACLAFLGAGESQRAGKHRATVQKAVARLIAYQNSMGRMSQDIREHALCTIALCEAAGMARVPKTMSRAQSAVDALILGQKTEGGFPAQFGGTDAELLDTTLACLALKSAKLARLRINAKEFQGIINYLARVADEDHIFIGEHETLSKAGATMMVLTMRLQMGWKPEELEKAADIAFGGNFSFENPRFLNLWLGSYVALSMGNSRWEAWRRPMRLAAAAKAVPRAVPPRRFLLESAGMAKRTISEPSDEDRATREAASDTRVGGRRQIQPGPLDTLPEREDIEFSSRLWHVLSRGEPEALPVSFQALSTLWYRCYYPMFR